MLQHTGKVFFRVATIDREEGESPRIYLDIYERDNYDRYIGQMRFNNDPTYSDEKEDIRMSFDVMDASEIAPLKGGSQLLEDIVVGGILWLQMDNHYIYKFVPKLYMVVHSYKQDEKDMEDINNKIKEILHKIGAKEEYDGGMISLLKEDINLDYASKFINRR